MVVYSLFEKGRQWGNIVVDTTAVNWSEYAKREMHKDGEILFLPEGKTTVKILAEGMNDTSWFQKFTQTYSYQGRETVSIKFAVRCVDMADRTAKVVIVPKSAMAQVFNLLAEGHDLLTPVTGKPVTFIRDKSGGKTSYQAMPTAKVFDSSEIETDNLLDFETVIERLTKPKTETDSSETDSSEIDW